MHPDDKKKAIEYLVHNVFLVEHNKVLAIFLSRYGEQVAKSQMLSMQVGIPIHYPPLSFDLRKPVEDLVNNLATIEILSKDKPL